MRLAGEAVEVGDVLFDIETDKATMAVEATEDGYLRQIVVRDERTIAKPFKHSRPSSTASALQAICSLICPHSYLY